MLAGLLHWVLVLILMLMAHWRQEQWRQPKGKGQQPLVRLALLKV